MLTEKQKQTLEQATNIQILNIEQVFNKDYKRKFFYRLSYKKENGSQINLICKEDVKIHQLITKIKSL